ncbi:MAG TPA: penicillin-binding protein 2 [Acidimicrobiales bacterium]|jgi:peptidoglycan glycosyltransferase|nr:penicillin-binding protein 2 [Acidimicrobiales bacterium]
MNRQLRRLGLGLIICYVGLFAMINYVQVWHAPALNDNPLNSRKIVRDFDRPRGQIISADGAVLAKSVPSAPGDPFAFQRQYPEGDLFGHVTGYININFGATGVEQQYNDQLSGQTVSQEYETLRDLFVDRDHTGDVTLTLRKDLQQSAREQLGERQGSIVVMDPRDGSILALWSYPSYDPNLLASHDAASAQAAKTLLDASPDQPLRGRTWQEIFFPGSTFKVVTGSTGLETGQVTPDNPVFPPESAYKPPDGAPIQNFGGEVCGGALFEILRVSCNSAFAQMGAEVIGQQNMEAGARSFGFNEKPPIDLPAAAPSVFGDTEHSKALLGQASIGQRTTKATPLEMALVTAGVANGGIIMSPHVMNEIRDDNGKVIDTFDPSPWRTAVNPQAATTMRQAMIGVVQGGTGTAARIRGVEVGGKTGTAELDDAGSQSEAWFTCFAGPPGGPPQVVVTVLVENQPGASEGTGGRVAAPIAAQLVQQALAVQ